MGANVDTLGRLAFGASSPATQFMEYISHDIGLQTALAHDAGIRGSLEQYKFRSRVVQKAVGGTLNLQPSPTEIDYWLPKILFGATAAGVTSVSDTPAASIYGIWDAGDNVFEWSGLVVDRATFSGSSGQPLNLALALEATSETKDGASFPALTPATDSMFVFSDLVVTLGGTAYSIEQFSLTIDYARIKDRFFNSLTRSEIPPTNRITTFGCTVPFNADHDDLYEAAIAGVAGTLAMSDGTTTYTVAFANLKKPTEKLGSRGRAELKFPMNFQSFNDGTNPSVKFTKT